MTDTISQVLREHAHRQEILADIWMALTVLAIGALVVRWYREPKQ